MNENNPSKIRAMGISADDVAHRGPTVRPRGNDVSDSFSPASRRDRSGSLRDNDRPGFFRSFIAANPRRSPEGMIIIRHGVPHKLVVDWRGACFWMIQCAALLLAAGWWK